MKKIITILYICAFAAHADIEILKGQMANPDWKIRYAALGEYLKDKKDGDEIQIIATLDKSLPKDNLIIEEKSANWQYIRLLSNFNSKASIDWLLMHINFHSSANQKRVPTQELKSKVEYYPCILSLLDMGNNAQISCETKLIKDPPKDESLVEAMCLFIKAAHSKKSDVKYTHKDMSEQLLDKINSMSLVE